MKLGLRPRILFPLLVLAAIGCAQASTDDQGGDGDGDGDNGTMLPSGGSLTISGSGGNSLVGAGGMMNLGGEGNTGGSNTGGGASTGGGTPGAGGTTFDGNCAELPHYSEVTTTGDFGVYVCLENRDGCLGAALNEAHVFKCVATHAPNCTQNPGQTQGSWAYVAPCSSWGMGGATNE